MGNKICTMLPKNLKIHKKPKPDGFVKSKVVTSNKIADDDDDDVFLTPESDFTDSDEKQEDHDKKFPSFVCEICVEQKGLNDSFNLKGCTHFYCSECTVNYVKSKLDDNITSISCPISDCAGVLEPEFCREILPEEVFNRWGLALCESLIDGSLKFYCPYKNCSGLLINDTGVEIQQTDCPLCKRAFCVKCEAPWHSEISCEKFQKLKKKGDDSMLVDLAKRKNWRRCPKCKFYVEKSVGCFYMKCRCGFAFCYKCGARSSTTSHACPKCKH
ncbi:E3 ubiquitin-protein ligase RSL1-like [Mercurialis annua]|uniref:E3 ubiquitin-protein ligase RSL1-like n=1 Tax=Mercurialis annua TaxID=3986 RepID=UPI00216061FA|nr:E3 ubiquitin-protein ligase RSL1-like [Mercurialis annua]